MNIKNNKKHTLFAFVFADGQIFNASLPNGQKSPVRSQIKHNKCRIWMWSPSKKLLSPKKY